MENNPFDFLEGKQLYLYNEQKERANQKEKEIYKDEMENNKLKQWFNFQEYNSKPNFENDYNISKKIYKEKFWGKIYFAFDLKNKKKVFYNEIDGNLINLERLMKYVFLI